MEAEQQAIADQNPPEEAPVSIEPIVSDTSADSVAPEVIEANDVQVLETVEDIQGRRHQVLGRYEHFQNKTHQKRSLLEDARRFQYFKRDGDELESWILEKLQAASDENYKDPINLQAKIQKHQAFEAEVAAHADAITRLDELGKCDVKWPVIKDGRLCLCVIFVTYLKLLFLK
jgi:hypothetical protein